METFSFNPPRNLSEEGTWMLATPSSEATNSVFNLFNENNSFSMTTQRYWTFRGGSAQTINELLDLLRLRQQQVIELHVKEV